MAAEGTRTLVVVRHAKAEPKAGPDHERTLTARGRKDALAAGRWLAGARLRPDLALCSPAARARETWALAAAELEDPVPTTYERGIYDADLDDLLTVVREAPDDAATLLLVGHNPAVQALVLALAGVGEQAALGRAREKFGTAAIAVLAVPVPWAQAAADQATLTEMTVARG